MTGKGFTDHWINAPLVAIVLTILMSCNMGTPLPPNEPGNPCTVCWGVGKPFGEAPTPKTLEVRLTSLLPGELWEEELEQLLLTTHYLEQTLSPCFWKIKDGEFTWSLSFDAGATIIQVIRTLQTGTVFASEVYEECVVDIENHITSPNNVFAYNGFANITWNPEDLE